MYLLFGAMLTVNTMHLDMAGEKTGSDEDNLDTMDNTDRCLITDNTDRSLMTDISDSLSYLSPTGRKKRQKEKLRMELVQEHIQNQKREPSLLQSLADKLTRPL
jgi:hypothetical protein